MLGRVFTVWCGRFSGFFFLHYTYMGGFPLLLYSPVEGWELVYTRCGAPSWFGAFSSVM